MRQGGLHGWRRHRKDRCTVGEGGARRGSGGCQAVPSVGPLSWEGFHLAQTPVTQAQWRAVAGWLKLKLEVEAERNANFSRFQGANRPAERVSWEAAMEFCRRLIWHTGRACTHPSEAQWE